MDVLKIENLSVHFGGIEALSKIDLSIRKGEFRGLIGPNGSGKTTLLNSISGFNILSGGRIFYCGEEISNFSPYKRAIKGIGRTFQKPELFPTMTVLENMLVAYHKNIDSGILGAAFRCKKMKEQEKKAMEKVNMVMESLEIEILRDRVVSSLSYGEKRMVEIGRALVLTPALLLMDEPASGLSITEMGNLWKAMGSIKEKGEVAVISAEHTLGFILGISDRITVLNKGQKIAEGNPDEIKENEEVIKVYLGEKEN